jgi:hypothetical protein
MAAWRLDTFLPVPLTGPDRVVTDSDNLLTRLSSAGHLWVQGGTGMGKTATFRHLIHTHFAGAEATSFALFRRSGYVLVPIEARAFPKRRLRRRAHHRGLYQVYSACCRSGVCPSPTTACYAKYWTRARSALPSMV